MNQIHRVATFARASFTARVIAVFTLLMGLMSVSLVGCGPEGGDLSDLGDGGASDGATDGGANDAGQDAGADASVEVCQTGSTLACMCSDGRTGAQTCNGSRQWDQCVCSSSNTCTVNSTQTCACTSGGSGTQTCQSNGTWGTCSNCTNTCTNGATQACACTSGGTGTQTCTNGAWGTCSNCTGSGNICYAAETNAPCGAACLVNGVTVCLWTPEQIGHEVFYYCSRDQDGDGLTPEQGDCNDGDRNNRWCHTELSQTPPPLCRTTSYVVRGPSS